MCGVQVLSSDTRESYALYGSCPIPSYGEWVISQNDSVSKKVNSEKNSYNCLEICFNIIQDLLIEYQLEILI